MLVNSRQSHKLWCCYTLVWLLLSVVQVFGQQRSITGTVMSGDGTFPWQITLALIPVSNSAGSKQTTEVADDGSFRFEDVAPGQYMIQFSQSSSYVWTEETKKLLRVRRWQPGDHAALEIIKGGVITGVVTKATGEPAVGLKVRALPIKSQANDGIEGRADDRGQYRIYGLQAGNYVVAAYPDQAGRMPSFHPFGTRDVAGEIEVAVGLERSGIDIQLHDQQGWSISGRVLNAQAGVSILVRLLRADGSNDVAQVPTNQNGYFLLPRVPEGNYLLLAEEQARMSQPQQVSLRGSDVSGLKLTLTPLAEVTGQITIAAPPAGCALFVGKLQGQHLELQHHKPPAWSRVAEAEAMTDRSGAFQFQPLLPGPYQLRLTAEYLYLREVKSTQKVLSPAEISLAAGAKMQLKLALDYGGNVIGKAPATSQIWFFTSQGQVVSASQVDQKGRFRSEALAPGEYHLLTVPHALSASDAALVFQRQHDKAQTVVVKPCQTSEFIIR